MKNFHYKDSNHFAFHQGVMSEVCNMQFSVYRMQCQTLVTVSIFISAIWFVFNILAVFYSKSNVRCGKLLINILSGKPLIHQYIQYSLQMVAFLYVQNIYHIISFESRDVKITKMREYAGVLVKENMYNLNEGQFWAVLCHDFGVWWKM